MKKDITIDSFLKGLKSDIKSANSAVSSYKNCSSYISTKVLLLVKSLIFFFKN